MSDKIKQPVVLCAGCEPRLAYAAERLAEKATVYSYGGVGGYGVRRVRRILYPEDMDERADILLLPMPCGMNISCCEGDRPCSFFTGFIKKKALAAGGKMDKDVAELFASEGYDTADYLMREELALKNCIPTAEGALAAAMNGTVSTIWGTETLIVGWGRVAKACAGLFRAAGAKTAVSARSVSQLAEAECSGHRAIRLSELENHIAEYGLIINTVPAPVIDERLLCRTDRNCFVIDLASMPGGVDFSACEKYGRKYLHALALPGKCAPKTAGEIIADTVLNIFYERRGGNVT